MWKKFTKVGSVLSLVFEDDERVAYAYLLDEGNIVGDVWLYNKQPAPHVPEWKIDKNPPYLNAKSYVREELPFRVPTSEEDVQVQWIANENGAPGARIYFSDRVAGELYVGSKPGSAAAASKKGPLAGVLGD